MRKVKVSDFKARLARYLRMVVNGEEVILVSRSLPIASVRALNSDQQPSITQATRDLGQLLGELPAFPVREGTTDSVTALIRERRLR